MSNYQINIVYSAEDGGYIADIPDLVSCSAFGYTPEEAFAEVQRAKAIWIAAALAEGKAMPAAGELDSGLGRAVEASPKERRSHDPT